MMHLAAEPASIFYIATGFYCFALRSVPHIRSTERILDHHALLQALNSQKTTAG